LTTKADGIGRQAGRGGEVASVKVVYEAERVILA
jgi:hypothetical protein